MNRLLHRQFCSRAIVTAALLLVAVAAAMPSASAADTKNRLDPTFEDVAYGPYESNKLDFWKAASDKPTPLIVEIHGGGFYEGDKSGFRGRDADNIARSLSMGVSLASINYRFINAVPIQDIVRDSARAIQFLRYNAAAWNIDKTRIAAFGESAGAGTSLWLAFHDDLADPNNADPVLHESTRLIAAGALAPQASYDFATWPEILHIPRYIWYAANWHVSPNYYHFSVLGPYTEKGRKVRADLDMLSWIDPKDPPVYLCSNQWYTDLTYTNLFRFAYMMAAHTWNPAKHPQDPSLNFDILHHPAHAQALEKACQRANVPCTAIYRDTPQDQKISVFDFLLKQVAP